MEVCGSEIFKGRFKVQTVESVLLLPLLSPFLLLRRSWDIVNGVINKVAILISTCNPN